MKLWILWKYLSLSYLYAKDNCVMLFLLCLIVLHILCSSRAFINNHSCIMHTVKANLFLKIRCNVYNSDVFFFIHFIQKDIQSGYIFDSDRSDLLLFSRGWQQNPLTASRWAPTDNKHAACFSLLSTGQVLYLEWLSGYLFWIKIIFKLCSPVWS